jgi:aminopeptidase N
MAPSADVVLLQGSTEIPAGSCGEAIKVNLGDIGYYRVEYGPTSMAALAKALPQMSPADRVNFLADGWAMVQAGRAEPSSYLALVENVGIDDRRPVWDQIITVFSALNHLSRDRPERPALQRYIRAKLRPVFDRLGWDGSGSGDEDTRRTRRRSDHCGSAAAVRRIPQRSAIAAGRSARFRHPCRRHCGGSRDLRHAADAGAQEHRHQ